MNDDAARLSVPRVALDRLLPYSPARSTAYTYFAGGGLGSLPNQSSFAKVNAVKFGDRVAR
jgi:hypothetical protein